MPPQRLQRRREGRQASDVIASTSSPCSSSSARRSATPAGRTSCGSGRRSAISSSWRAQLDHPAVLDHADAVGLAHGGEAVRDEDRGACGGSRRAPARRSPPRPARRAAPSARRAAPRPAPRRTAAQRAGQRDPLPLPAGEVDAAVVALGERSCRGRRGRRAPGVVERGEDLDVDLVAARRRCDVVAQRQLVAHEVLEHRGDPTAPRVEVERRGGRRRRSRSRRRLRVVEAAEQLGERRLARAVLADDGQSTIRPGW